MIMDKLAWFVVLLLAIATKIVDCYSAGAPAVACTRLTPNPSNHDALPQNSQVPYKIDLSAFEDETGDFSYIPEMTYLLTLSGVYDSQTFEGFLLQGREMMDDSKSAGTFIASDPLTKLISCQNDQDSVTQTSNVAKSSITTLWTAPPEGTGPVCIEFAVEESLEMYWANQRSAVIYEHAPFITFKRNPTTTTESLNALSPPPVTAPTHAPGDEDVFCTTNNEVSSPPTPSNARVLLDSYNYVNLLPPHDGAVWQRVKSVEKSVTEGGSNWIQNSKSPCRQRVEICGLHKDSQDNWLITQYISRTVSGTPLLQVSVLIDFEHDCNDRDCQRTFMLNAYETSVVDDSAARNTGNYRQIHRITTSNDRSQQHIREFAFETDEDGFYLAIADEGACITILRVIVFYNICPWETKQLVILPETIAPLTNHMQPLEVMGECTEDAHPENGVAPTLTCLHGGVWLFNPDSSCQCNIGFKPTENESKCIPVPKLSVSLINGSPRACNKNTIAAEFSSLVPLEFAYCSLTSKSSFKNTNCTSGQVEFKDLKPATYTFNILAKSIHGGYYEDERTIIFIGDEKNSCSVHLINEGVTISRKCARVQFSGCGKIESFKCSIDNGILKPCASPAKFCHLENGSHTVKVFAVGKQCSAVTLTKTFNVKQKK